MNRSLLQRTTAALLAGIFLLAGTADVYGLHDCPHHDHGGGDAAVQAAEATPPGHDAHVTSGQPEHEPPAGAPCTCVGTCHGSAAAPVVAQGPESPATDLVRAERRLTAPTRPAPSTDPTAFLIPYPNGPPLIG